MSNEQQLKNCTTSEREGKPLIDFSLLSAGGRIGATVPFGQRDRLKRSFRVSLGYVLYILTGQWRPRGNKNRG